MIKSASIIGSNGYLGRNMTFFLQDKGIELFCYDIHENSLTKDCNYISLDITRKDQVPKINTYVDAIFLLAGLTGTENSFASYNEYIDVNEKGILNLLDFLKDKGSDTRVIFPSSRLVYKGKKDVPLKEDSELEPKTIYALNKIACESILKIYNNTFNIDYNIFRLCVPYGNLVQGGVSYGTIEFFLKKAYSGEDIELFGSGEPKRTFSHIKDICNLIYETIVKPETKNEIYNIGGETYSLYDIAKIISKIYNVGIQFKPWPYITLKIESGDTIFDDRKISGITKNETYISFESWIKTMKS